MQVNLCLEMSQNMMNFFSCHCQHFFFERLLLHELIRMLLDKSFEQSIGLDALPYALEFILQDFYKPIRLMN